MPGSPWATLFAVWLLTTLTRLLPGALTAAAVRLGREVGVRQAAAFLLGAWGAELGVTAAVLGVVGKTFGDSFHGWAKSGLALPLGLGAAGLVLLWPPSLGRCREQGGVRRASIMAGGCALALTTPGVWSWWATFGFVLIASGRGAGGELATGVAVAAGMGTSHLLVLATLRTAAVQKLKPPEGVQQRLGAALLVAGALVALLT